MIISLESVQSNLLRTKERLNPRIDFRIRGISHAAVAQEEDRRTRSLVHQVKNHSNKDALIADLQDTRTYNPFDEESKPDDSFSGKRGMLRVVRDLFQSAMCLLHEVLDRRDGLLYLWHMLDSQRIYTILEQM